MSKESWRSGSKGLLLSFALIFIAWAMIPLQIPTFWANRLGLVMGASLIIAIYWIFSALLGKGNLLKSKAANLLLVVSFVLFLVFLMHNAFLFLPTPMYDCVDISTGASFVHQKCKVDRTWVSVFEYGSILAVVVSLIIRIIESRRSQTIQS